MKLKLNKEKIAKLTKEQASSVNGGGTNHSTQHNFTCCWCTNTGGVTNLDTCGSPCIPPGY
ncbi:class I lanthipeptide [Flagellimonas onchidii]|uniref:class I lanthipeptide n=1 Tax=Flagellimonas onchidii TaxID=2562684 RepID=UPI0010A5EC14|nr:class I lanthipeptide [Allomuricauda onchidii]